MTPGGDYPGTVYVQELLVVHETGHILGGPEDFSVGDLECWLFNTECGTTLMASMWWGGNRPIFRFSQNDARNLMGPLMNERLR